MENSTNKPTTTFWVISVVALLWNLIGVIAYLGQAYMTDEILATLSEPEQLYYANVAAWATAAFATAVFGGTLGCILLLIRKKLATILFVISLIAVLIQGTYNFFIQEFMPIEPLRMILPIVTILISVFLVWYSKDVTKKGWIS
jgi:hypothetical protein